MEPKSRELSLLIKKKKPSWLKVIVFCFLSRCFGLVTAVFSFLCMLDLSTGRCLK